MINQVIVMNPHDDILVLELRYPDESGFAVMSIDGLDPPKANINMTELSSSDGSVFNSSRVSSRNIVLKLKILEHYTIEEARHLLYKYFPIKKKVTLIFVTDTRVVYTEGYVETDRVEIFSNFEIAQISIICPDSYFYSVSTSNNELIRIISAFEFPFSNPVGERTLITGELVAGDPVTIYYDGDADTGVLIQIRALGTAENPSVANLTTGQTMTIDTDKLAELTGAGLTEGDIITINTIVGQKRVYLTRNDEIYNILSCVGRSAGWIKLEYGDNNFQINAESGIFNLRCEVSNNILYEGI